MHLPPSLRTALENYLEGLNHSGMAEAAEAVSARYRRLGPAQDLRIRTPEEAAAYLAVRFPATWAAIYTVLQKLPADFAPAHMLDVGAGPATATLAARILYPDITSALVEPNAPLRAAGFALYPGAAYSAQDFSAYDAAYNEKEKHDLVCAAYSLNEMSEPINTVVERLWAYCAGILVLVEPGTPAGADIIVQAREWLRTQGGAHILAPCPHALACPLADNTERWCHFSVRVERSRLHRQIKKDATLPYEDEKFSYLIAARHPYEHPAGDRVLGYPQGSKIVRLELCRADGTFGEETIPRSHPRHAAARRAAWGDRLE